MKVFWSTKAQRLLTVLIAVVFVYQCVIVFTTTDSWQLAELQQNERQFRLAMNNSSLPLKVLHSSSKVELVGVNNSNNELLTSSKNVRKSQGFKAVPHPMTELTIVQSSVTVKNSHAQKVQQQIFKSPVSVVSHGRKQLLEGNATVLQQKPVRAGSIVPLKLVKGGQYLDERIRQLYLACTPKVLRNNPDAHMIRRCKNITDMRFINGSRVVALSSYPGSGNTWARMLLEQATGIFTGSIYCDRELKARGLFGEKLSSSNVLAVKTHYPNQELFVPYKEFHDPEKFKNVTAAIVIIRNPLNSLVSHWNWKHGGHISQMKPALFGMLYYICHLMCVMYISSTTVMVTVWATQCWP